MREGSRAGRAQEGEGLQGKATYRHLAHLLPSICLSSSRFRLLCHRIITHKMFDHVVLVIIFLNCITIAMERPKIDPHCAVSHQRLNPGAVECLLGAGPLLG